MHHVHGQHYSDGLLGTSGGEKGRGVEVPKQMKTEEYSQEIRRIEIVTAVVLLVLSISAGAIYLQLIPKELNLWGLIPYDMQNAVVAAEERNISKAKRENAWALDLTNPQDREMLQKVQFDFLTRDVSCSVFDCTVVLMGLPRDKPHQDYYLHEVYVTLISSGPFYLGAYEYAGHEIVQNGQRIEVRFVHNRSDSYFALFTIGSSVIMLVLGIVMPSLGKKLISFCVKKWKQRKAMKKKKGR
jgi:hypothetical protein